MTDAPLDRLACLAGRSWRVQELPGGLTNINLHVTTADGLDVVVRWSQGDAELLGIDRDAEAANTATAYDAGVGAEVVEYRPDLAMLVIGFLQGEALENADFADPGVLARAALATRELHAGPRFTGDFDMFTRQEAYLTTVKERGYALPQGYDDHADAWSDVRRALARSPRPTVPCNNDLLAANFIDDGERCRLIDYEYSGNNDACFELGNTATECDFTPEQVEAYAEAYFGSPTRADLARVRLQMLCSEYGWSLWGFIQAAASPIDYDFHGWGMERYDKAVATFRGPALTGLLEDVARG
ncbi:MULTISPECIES: choline kinase family protein [unclassified Nocardioides]|uniref:choline kinase family protein n=1 Tax=unclassified Nocardioides TaxID=2615069 RepID=UPI0009F0AA92|nr:MULTISPECIES: choline kinase family protein [unclassified Nocardioides]GAW48323.1 choline/ethanolamine kinase [Nocardioides sp. PD653-B2]GAW53248.1 choline/ethanolamine kinase [Nocardioides sp. PD653]